MFDTIFYWLYLLIAVGVGFVIGYTFGFFRGVKHLQRFVDYVEKILHELGILSQDQQV